MFGLTVASDSVYEDLVYRCQQAFRKLQTEQHQAEAEGWDPDSCATTQRSPRRLRWAERRQLSQIIAHQFGFGMKHEVTVTQRSNGDHYLIRIVIAGGTA